MLDQGVLFSEAQQAYESAFREFSRQVRALQALAAEPAPDAQKLEEARRRVEPARRAYRECRDRLVELMLLRVTPSGEEQTVLASGRTRECRRCAGA